MALSNDSKQEDEVNVGAFVGDPDTLSYQPIRDLNVDVEKLLEHLPSKIVLLLVVFTQNYLDRGLSEQCKPRSDCSSSLIRVYTSLECCYN